MSPLQALVAYRLKPRPRSHFILTNKSNCRSDLNPDARIGVRKSRVLGPQLVNGLVNSVRQLAGSGLDPGPAT